MTLAVGLMSGTSMDGVSLTLTRFSRRKFRLLAYRTYPYPDSLTRRLRQARNLQTPELSRLNVLLGIFFAGTAVKFLKQTGVPFSRIAVIGSHGQTVYHEPNGVPRHTLQIGDPSYLAEATGIPVVADFRMRDLAAGGEGAPLLPFFDDYFFGGGPLRALQNIGGIANVTVAGSSQPPFAFDNGPGNCLIDLAVQKMTRGRRSFDRNGAMAERGIVRMEIVRKLSRHPYFAKRPPKSTGPELFNLDFVPRKLFRDRPENIAATLTHFTAHTLAESYRRWVRRPLKEIIVSGGGALNPVLMKHLGELCRPIPVRSITEWKLHPQSKEPAAFSFLALRALHGKTNHLRQTTGARKSCILGKIIR